jgi:hypothetical protein
MLTLALALATILSAAPQNGVVYTADGGRLRGSVLEAGPGGVAVQLPDGTTRKLDAAQGARVDFADGTTWSPKAGAPAAAAAAVPAAAPQQASGAPPQAATGAAPQPAPAVAAAAPAAAPATGAAGPAAPGPSSGPVIPAATAASVGLAGSPPPPTSPRPAAGPMVAFPDKLDTVFLARGGRVRGLVVEETQDGVVMRLVDGSERRFTPAQVARVEYAGSASPAPADAPAVKPTR